MTTITRAQLPFVLCVVLAVGACAQQPSKDSPRLTAQAARYGVSPKLLHSAENGGFWPQMRDGEALFCRATEVTGSDIGEEECLDAAHLQTRLEREADEQRRDQQEMEQNHAACTPSPGTAC